MIHPIPPGSRDILPDEMRELRALRGAMLDAFERFGYGEVATPAIEYDEVLARGDGRAADRAYKFFDENGDLLALRTEMTIPIARMVASRFEAGDAPLRFGYVTSSFRAVRPQRGEVRELIQAGVELIGEPGPEGTAEVVEVLAAALDAAGLSRAVIGIGDADLYGQLLTELGVGDDERDSILPALAAHDLVALEAALAAAGVGEAEIETCLSLAQMRGGVETIERAAALGGEAVARATGRLGEAYAAIERRGAAGRVQIDLGLLRDLGYYSGAILEVYDPAVGRVLGGGGRYDGLLGRFGLDLPAAGFALNLERVHLAQLREGVAG